MSSHKAELAELKNLFGVVAKEHGFDSAFGGWFAESDECLLALGFQRSQYGPFLYLNFKVFVQGMFGNRYERSKRLLTDASGNVFRGQPPEFSEVLSLENSLTRTDREVGIRRLFDSFIVPFTKEALSKEGLQRLQQKGEVFFLPAVEAQLKLLLQS